MRHRTRAGGATLRQGLLLVLLAAGTGTAAVPALAQPPAADATALQAAHRIEAQLETTYAAMERLTEQADAAAERQKDLRQVQKDLEDRRTATSARLAIVQAQLDQEARAVYIAGPEFFVSE